uniref:Fucosyltransferase n=1 Tax=Aegilops tauschii subsp. strangulata TaxID=200361 RepID=A0A453DJL9_AEGTS
YLRPTSPPTSSWTVCSPQNLARAHAGAGTSWPATMTRRRRRSTHHINHPPTCSPSSEITKRSKSNAAPARPRTGRRSGSSSLEMASSQRKLPLPGPHKLSRPREPDAVHSVSLPLRCAHRAHPPRPARHGRPLLRTFPGDNVAAPVLRLVGWWLPAWTPQEIRQGLQGEPRQHAQGQCGIRGRQWERVVVGLGPATVRLPTPGWRLRFLRQALLLRRAAAAHPRRAVAADEDRQLPRPRALPRPIFRDELERMFPEKDVAFHHLGRYLFHPANDVWRAVTRYYDAHLAGAGQRVGIQIRVFTQNKPLQKVLDQVLSCVRREKLFLPSVQMNNASVLVTSLSSWYYERIKAEYGGSRVHQPSHEGNHEGWQKMWDASQDRKALSEMYLLSTCDVLVTTGFSTFGYVAQGLGEILPWIMPATPFWSTETGVVPDPPCMRAMSVEPCFHSPSNYDCAARKDVDVGTLVPYIRHCEDASWGLKHHHTEVY